MRSAHESARDERQKEIDTNFISGTAVTPVEVTILSIQFPLPCVIGLRVYMSYSYSNNSIGRGKDGRMSCIIITAQCMSHIFYLYC